MQNTNTPNPTPNHFSSISINKGWQKIDKLSINNYLYSSTISSLSPHYILHYYDKNISNNDNNINELDSISGLTTLQQSALFFHSINSIKIPSGVEHILLTKHLDVETKELCLLFLSNLVSTYFTINSINCEPTHRELEGWKNLNTNIINQQFGNNDRLRLRIIGLLKRLNIIECDYKYKVGLKSYSYRLTEYLRGKGIRTSLLTSKKVIRLLMRSYYRELAKANNNVICKALIDSYGYITLPTEKQIIEEAKRLIKEGYHTKKGKRLLFKNKHKKNYYKGNNSFVEESIELFNHLTGDGYMIPTPGNERSGGRVIDSFTLMPSWIRNLIKINGRKLIESDYSALHPNIAVSLYDGNKKYITHQMIADETGIDKNIVKVEHLSFFNKEVCQMKKSPLWDYYINNEPRMMENIINEKYKYGYKITSMRMFKKEVEIMTSVIQKLSEVGIRCLYIYDALAVPSNFVEYTKLVMNQVALKYNVYTTAK